MLFSLFCQLLPFPDDSIFALMLCVPDYAGSFMWKWNARRSKLEHAVNQLDREFKAPFIAFFLLTLRRTGQSGNRHHGKSPVFLIFFGTLFLTEIIAVTWFFITLCSIYQIIFANQQS